MNKSLTPGRLRENGPVIVDCAVYKNGHRRPGRLALEEAYRAARDKGAFVWIGLHEPTPEEFDSVRHEFDLHELAVEDAIKAHQRPKLEVYDDTLFMVLKTAKYVGEDEIDFGEILVFVGEGFVISVRHGEASSLGGVRREYEARPDLLRHGPGAVLHAIVDRVIDDYSPVISSIEEDIDEVERQVFSRTANPGERIYKLMAEVLDLHRAAAPLIGPLDRLASGRHSQIPEDVRTYFRDVHDHVLRVVEQIQQFRDLLSNVLTANLTEVSVRQNEDMRKISAYAALFAVPTMIAGFYGMNFEHMPELDWTFGYPLVMGVMAVIEVVLYRYFRRSGWI